MRRIILALTLSVSIMGVLSVQGTTRLFAGGRHRCCQPVIVPSECSESPRVSAADAIRNVLVSQAAAWNRGDLEGFMAGYWQSPDLTFMSGSNVTRGWQATLDRYRARYQGEGKEMGSLTFSDLEIMVFDADNAMVRGKWKLVKSKETVGGLYTLILKRLPEGWRIVHDHTSG
jgi:beta-aspartyl-peptidase (threonine type)